MGLISTRISLLSDYLFRRSGAETAPRFHIPGSDALGIVVDAGAAVKTVCVGQAVILNSWTSRNIRGYETHDGFNAQFAIVDQEGATPIPETLSRRLNAPMLDGQMTKPKGVALVQSIDPGHRIADYETAYLGQSVRMADPKQGLYLSVNICDGVALVTIKRPDALNALSEDLLAQNFMRLTRPIHV